MSKPRLQNYTSTCHPCGHLICPRGFCWCDDNRDPIAGLEGKFPSPVCDSSDGSFWWEEVQILRAVFAGDKRDSPLVENRGYMPDLDTYGVCFYWTNQGMSFPRQWDGPVVRLWSRLMLRPVRCAGGYTWIVLSDDARKLIEALPESNGRYHPRRP